MNPEEIEVDGIEGGEIEAADVPTFFGRVRDGLTSFFFDSTLHRNKEGGGRGKAGPARVRSNFLVRKKILKKRKGYRATQCTEDLDSLGGDEAPVDEAANLLADSDSEMPPEFQKGTTLEPTHPETILPGDGI